MKKGEKFITAENLLSSPQSVAMVVELLNNMICQIPEKPDYWCSCGQCERNIDRVDDIMDEFTKANELTK